jgi:hypothetical protein
MKLNMIEEKQKECERIHGAWERGNCALIFNGFSLTWHRIQLTSRTNTKLKPTDPFVI